MTMRTESRLGPAVLLLSIKWSPLATHHTMLTAQLDTCRPRNSFSFQFFTEVSTGRYSSTDSIGLRRRQTDETGKRPVKRRFKKMRQVLVVTRLC